MKWEVITPPTETPVSYADAKSWLRLDDDTEEALVTSLIQMATDYCEEDTQRSLVTRTIRATWYDSEPVGFTPIVLPRGPVQSVVSITDQYGNAVSLTGLQIRRTGTADYVWLPSCPSHPTVTYVAGYGTAADVPQKIKTGILAHVAHLFRNREAMTGENQKYVALGLQAIYGQVQAGGLGL